MWPFRRKAEASPAAGGPQPVPGPVIRRDWVGLPPIPRLIGEHPLTAPSERFSDDLATHHDPSVSAGSMGHQVSAEAPADPPVGAPGPVAQRLVSLSPDAAPLPVPPAPTRPRPISTPLPLNEPFEPRPAPHLTLGQSRGLGLGPPIKRVSDRSVQRTAVDSTPAPPPDPELDGERTAQASPPASAEPTARSARVVASSIDETPRLDLPLAPRPAAGEPSAERAASVDDAPLSAPPAPAETTATVSPNPPSDPTHPPATVQRLAQASPLPRPSRETPPAPRDVSALTAARSARL